MVESFARAWGRFCLNNRILVLILVALTTVVTGQYLRGTRFDNAIDLWFLDDDPNIVNHRRLLSTFGSDELIVVGIEAPDVFEPKVLEAIDRLSSAIEQAPHVEKVFSLTTIESIEGDGEVLEIDKLVRLPLEAAELTRLREKTLSNDLYVGNVVSEDGDFAAIIARLPHHADDFDYKIEAVTKIRELVAQETDLTTYLSGGPVIDERFFEISSRDSTLTTTLLVIALGLALWFFLRTVSGIALPLVTVIISAIWAMGWIVIAGKSLNVITMMLPPLLLAVGIADSMHFIVSYRQHFERLGERRDALIETFATLMEPLFLTSLTTSVGMLSLLISRVRAIREFGSFAALGVVGAFLLSITLVPIVLSYLAPPKTKAASGGSSHAAVWLGKLHRTTLSRAGFITAAFAVFAILAVLSATRVKAESHFLQYFKKNEPIRIQTELLEDALGGTVTLETIVATQRPDGIKAPATLRAIDSFQDFVEKSDIVTATQSVGDYFKDMRRAFFDNDQREYRLPASQEEAAQYLLLYEMDAPDGDLKEFATFDYEQTRVTARVKLTSSNEAAALVSQTQALSDRLFRDGIDAIVTGVTVLYANMEEYIRQSLIRGFTLALVSIWLILCIYSRSIPLGTISMIPNVVPILACLGVMGVFSINLDTSTAMVASIAIGLAVDDTVHFISHVRSAMASGSRIESALESATIGVGRALVYTSITLASGFAVMLLSDFVGSLYFGLLCTVTIIVALAADLLLLPVVLRWYLNRRAVSVAT